MLRDLVPQFTITCAENPDLVNDHHKLAEGLYIRLSLHEPFHEIKDKDYVVIKPKDQGDHAAKSELWRWFRSRDRLSMMLNANKAIDRGKKIHNVHFMALIAKKDSLMGSDKVKPVIDQTYVKQFLSGILEKPQAKMMDLFPINARKKAERIAQEEVRERFFQEKFPELFAHLSSEKRRKIHHEVLQFWENNFEQVLEETKKIAQSKHVKNYIKLFFQIEDNKDESLYDLEYQAYLFPNIFNVNDYNAVVDDTLLGLPSTDVNMNAKKPFLELKTMKTKVPTRVSLTEAVAGQEMYQWLQNKGKFKEIRLPTHDPFDGQIAHESKRRVAEGAYYLSLDKNGSVDYFDHVPFLPKEKQIICMEDILQIGFKQKDKSMLKDYPELNKEKGQIRQEISRLFFGNALPRNLLGSDTPKAIVNVFTSEMVSIFVRSRQALFDYLVKGLDETIVPFLRMYALRLIEIQILQCMQGLSYDKMADAFHLRLALLKEVNPEEGETMVDRMKEVYGTIKAKLTLTDEVCVCERDEEFFFLAGQLGYYLLYQSEKDDKTYGLAEPILRARNPKMLKQKLGDLFDVYKHKISLEHRRFKTAMAMVQSYQTDAKLDGENKEMLMAGLLANNLFLEKSKENVNKEETLRG
ncbi:hypothetical protein IC619_007130 [Hazenella sp. IB182353]|uniref:hypothetical protein n=1 Tax=Polycladospora coralii TaxID=2771432 RepID=UPI00174610FD|nr:hypothetical protein [Polycladospora coralii]MBS7530263.1 hypothetical protein [Polycladospora coralii]